MSRFLDGPARGQTLLIRRAPVMLRVVKCGRKWDALDQPEGVPAADEAVYVYICVNRPTQVHIHKRGGGSGWFQMGDYRLLGNQPGDEHTRDNAAWARWNEANRERLYAERARLMDQMLAEAST